MPEEGGPLPEKKIGPHDTKGMDSETWLAHMGVSPQVLEQIRTNNIHVRRGSNDEAHFQRGSEAWTVTELESDLPATAADAIAAVVSVLSGEEDGVRLLIDLQQPMTTPGGSGRRNKVAARFLQDLSLAPALPSVDHSVDQANLDLWQEVQCCPGFREAARSAGAHLRYVPFAEFYRSFARAVAAFKADHPPGSRAVCLSLISWEGGVTSVRRDKSNYWMSLFAARLLGDYEVVVLEDDFSNLPTDGPPPVVIFADDAAFSGEQMSNVQSAALNLAAFGRSTPPFDEMSESELDDAEGAAPAFQAAVVVGYATEAASKRLGRFGHVKLYRGERLETLGEQLGRSGIDAHNKAFRALNLNTKVPFLYFQHKLPDYVSTSAVLALGSFHGGMPCLATATGTMRAEDFGRDDSLCFKLVSLFEKHNWRLKSADIPADLKYAFEDFTVVSNAPVLPPYKDGQA